MSPSPRSTAALSRRTYAVTVLTALLGTGVLAWSLRTAPGSSTFYLASALLALVWIAGAFAATRLEPGTYRGRSPALLGVGVGLGLTVVFVLGALVVREISFLAGPVENVVDYAQRGTGLGVVAVAVLAGIGEELFFRGALYSAVRWRPILVTTVAYVVITAATGNLMLTFASALLGAVAGVERHLTGGVMASVLTHVTWSVAMIYALPLLFS